MKEQRDPKKYAIIGAAMEVHRVLGCGYLEAVYQEALEIELGDREIPFQPQIEIPITYKTRKLKTKYRPDFICHDSVIVEVKALDKLSGVEEAQVINYLKATGHPIGLLINFGTQSLEYRRFVFSKSLTSVKSADKGVS